MTQSSIDAINNLCHNYYQQVHTADALALTIWIGEIINGLITLPVKEVKQRFFMLFVENGDSPILNNIRNAVIELMTSEAQTIERINGNRDCNTIANLVDQLRTGSLSRPKVDFFQDREVYLIDNQDLSFNIVSQADHDEIDILQLDGRVLIIEPSMEPVSSLIWNNIDITANEITTTQQVTDMINVIRSIIAQW